MKRVDNFPTKDQPESQEERLQRTLQLAASTSAAGGRANETEQWLDWDSWSSKPYPQPQSQPQVQQWMSRSSGQTTQQATEASTGRRNFSRQRTLPFLPKLKTRVKMLTCLILGVSLVSWLCFLRSPSVFPLSQRTYNDKPFWFKFYPEAHAKYEMLHPSEDGNGRKLLAVFPYT